MQYYSFICAFLFEHVRARIYRPIYFLKVYISHCFTFASILHTHHRDNPQRTRLQIGTVVRKWRFRFEFGRVEGHSRSFRALALDISSAPASFTTAKCTLHSRSCTACIDEGSALTQTYLHPFSYTHRHHRHHHTPAATTINTSVTAITDNQQHIVRVFKVPCAGRGDYQKQTSSV
jgi:hypothetical protein